MEDPLLVYLSDHAASSDSAMALLGRWCHRVTEEPLHTKLCDLHAEIEADQAVLHELCAKAGAEVGAMKRTGGWFAEKLTRVREMWERLPEDLVLFESLELLSLGILGKRALWTALTDLAPFDHRLDGFEFGILEHRAVTQFNATETLRREVALRALHQRKHEAVSQALS